MKKLFFTTLQFNISLHFSYIPSGEKLADAPCRWLSIMNSRLSDSLGQIVQREFGGPDSHTCDIMGLYSNAIIYFGDHLPHFTPCWRPNSSGVNVFAQDLSSQRQILQRPFFVFLNLIYQEPCTIIVIYVYPSSTGGHYLTLALAILVSCRHLWVILNPFSFLRRVNGSPILELAVSFGRLLSNSKCSNFSLANWVIVPLRYLCYQYYLS